MTERPHAEAQRSAAWSRSQQSALGLLLIAAAIYAGTRLLRNPAYVSDPQPTIPLQAANVADRVDPNTAGVGELSALPQVGEKRAQEIAAYRSQIQRGQAGIVVFHQPKDLLRLRGFGPTLVDQMQPYLVFPATAPTSVPSGP